MAESNDNKKSSWARKPANGIESRLGRCWEEIIRSWIIQISLLFGALLLYCKMQGRPILLLHGSAFTFPSSHSQASDCRGLYEWDGIFHTSMGEDCIRISYPHVLVQYIDDQFQSSMLTSSNSLVSSNASFFFNWSA